MRRTYILNPPESVQTMAEYSAFLTPFCTWEEPTGLYIPKVGEFSIDGTCSHPDAVEVTE